MAYVLENLNIRAGKVMDFGMTKLYEPCDEMPQERGFSKKKKCMYLNRLNGQHL